MVGTAVTEVKRASLRFTYTLHREGEERLLAPGSTVHACITREGRPTRLPESLLATLPQQEGSR